MASFIQVPMDGVDIVLIQQLLMNSRAPYRELAEKLGLSVNAVHKSVNHLMELGVIEAFTARVGLMALEMDSVTVLAWGNTTSNTIDEITERLGADDTIYWVTVTGGNNLYIGAHLKGIGDLNRFVSLLRSEGQMKDPTIMIQTAFGGPTTTAVPLIGPLSSLDYRIIHSLRKDSRKRVSTISEELGVSATTVRRRLSKMMDEGSIELSLEWYPDKSNDIMTIIHLDLDEASDGGMIVPILYNQYSPNVLFHLGGSNMPNHFVCIIWTNTMGEVQDIRRRLEAEDIVKTAMPNVIHDGKLYDTWRDEIVKRKASN